MENFKKTIKKRMGLYACTVLAGLSVSVFIMYKDNAGTIPANMEEIAGFLSGFLTGLSLVLIFMLIKYGRTLKDEHRMRELMNKETDERMVLIRQKCGLPMLLITSLAMIFAGIIAGCYSFTIFCTLVIAAMCQIALCIILKFYYMHTL